MPPFSKHIDEEGVAIKSMLIVDEHKQFKYEELSEVFNKSRTLPENLQDLQAQVSSNSKGI